MLKLETLREFWFNFSKDDEPRTAFKVRRMEEPDFEILENTLNLKRQELTAQGLRPEDPIFTRRLFEEAELPIAAGHVVEITNAEEEGKTLTSHLDIMAFLKKLPRAVYQALWFQISRVPELGELQRKV